MVLKKPVISADCKTGPREILFNENEYNELITKLPNGDSTRTAIEGEFGILVPDMGEEVDLDPNNITDEERILAREISALLADSEKEKAYAAKAYERALFYTPQKYKASIHEIFKRYE